MNLLDALILLPIVFFAFRGFINGIIKEVLSILGIILAVFLAFHYMNDVAAFFRSFFDSHPTLILVLSALAIFIAVITVANLLAYAGKTLLETLHLNAVNRIAGLAFGLLKGGIIISSLLLLLAGFNIPDESLRRGSLSYPYVINLAPWAYNGVASVYPGAENFTKTLQHTLDEYHPIKNFPFYSRKPTQS